VSKRYSLEGLDADLLMLAVIRARYDHGAMPPGIYALVKKIETEISWRKRFTSIDESASRVVNTVRPVVAPSPQPAVKRRNGVTTTIGND
jgi:hypothetical protein